ncbi:MAG: alginate O-acetyltransferase [Sinimarinibacterium flocculans]|uniref:alginate O-acetyltransferase n=1 Tax=Sinimarinibacterium flocculans TaxID=985250 RepID=UPI003C5D7623
MRSYALVHTALFIGSIAAIGATAVARTWPDGAPPAIPDAGRVAAGDVARDFESLYDERFPVRTFGTNVWAAVQYLLFREGRPGVIVGEHGWLYTAEEFRGWPQAQARIDAHLDLIASVHRRMAGSGSALVVALVPAKARVYPEHRGDETPASVHDDLYRQARSALLARGIMAPDLLTAMQRCKTRSEVFLRTDTHWTPRGAQCAAEEIALNIAPLRAPDIPMQDFVTEHGAPATHAGDLTRFLPLAPHFAALLPAPDTLTPSTTFAAGQNDLLNDTPTPATVLIGTSYSADPAWNFDGALKTALREDVLNLAESGHGPFAPMRRYLESGVGPSARVVVWELPERYLPMPDPAMPNEPSTGEST